MKKRILALALAVIMTVSLLSVGASAAKTSLFADVKTSDWFYNAVDYVNSNGLMTGTGKGFAPNDATTRAQIWAILARLGGENYDRTTSDWYAGYQVWAIRNNISDGTNPNGQITREQLATMLYRYAIHMGFVSKGAWADLSVYPDAANVSEFALEAVQWAVGCGLIEGMGGKLNPQGTATRAQVATILWRMCEKWALLPEQDMTGILGALQTTYQQHVHQYTYASNNNGTHTGTCTTCGESKAAENCSYVESAATETADGVNGKKYTCSVCGDYYLVAYSDDGQLPITPVARIGSTAYTNLADAIDAAEDGVATEIVLIKDTDGHYTIPVSKKITLNLNGKTLDGGTDNQTATLKNLGTVTITGNGTIKRNDTASSDKTFYTIWNEGTMTIENGTVKNNAGTLPPQWSGSSLICNGNEQTATLTINGGTFAQDNFIIVKNDEKGTLTINGGSFTANGEKGQSLQNWKNANVNGGTFTGEITTWTYSYTKTISGHSTKASTRAYTYIDGTAVVNGRVRATQYYADESKSSYLPVVYIKGGTFTGTLETGKGQTSNNTYVVDTTYNTSATIQISGGSFNTAGTALTETQFAAMVKTNYVYDKAGDVYTVRPLVTGDEAAVAEVNGVAYESLKDALTAVKNNTSASIKLLKDETSTVTMSIMNKNVTLDLNGHNITLTNKSGYFSLSKTTTGTVNPELHIIGSGTITVATDSSGGAIVAKNNAVITIGENVTLENTNSCAILIDAVKSKSENVKVTIDGTVKGKGFAATVNGNVKNTDKCPEITVSSTGKVICTSPSNGYAIYAAGYAKWNIAGTVSGNGAIEAKAGEINITGSSVTASASTTGHVANDKGNSTDGYAIVAVDNKNYAGNTKFNISGGSITGTVAIVDDDAETENNTATISITGGSFSADPSSYVVTGHTATESGGTYTVAAQSE